MESKNIIIISRTLFPSQAPRSFRTTELAKEFSRKGHNVTVYAVLGDYDYLDFEQSTGIKVRNLGKTRFARKNSDGFFYNPSSFISKAVSKILKKLIEFPDIELAFKVVSVLKKAQKSDLLITVAVPFTLHWGAAFYFNRFNFVKIKKWIADCGDPYMGNKLNKKLFYFKYIEKWSFRQVNFISIPIVDAKCAYYSEFHDKIKIIPQGFDFNFKDIKNERTVNNEILTFIYAGVFYKGIRDPRPFLDYLKLISKKFKFIIYTKNSGIIDSYKEFFGERLEVKNYIPRIELLEVMKKADFLINFDNGTDIQSPSKLIDYAIANRPILSINARALNKDTIDEFFNGDYSNKLLVSNVEKYHISNVADQFLNL